MPIDNYLNLEEVITKELFKNSFKLFFEELDKYNEVEQLEILEILSEKYSKFNNTMVLTEFQRNALYDLMVKLTNFNDLNVIQDLGFVSIGFDLYSYYLYLKKEFLNQKLDNNIKNVLLDIFTVFESKNS